MDSQHFDLADAQEPSELSAPYAREGYDESALGVECAWPIVEREALLTRS